MSETTIVLELTEREAQTLARLTSGVLWRANGTFGEDAEAIYNALDGIGVTEAKFKTNTSAKIWRSL